MAIFLSVLKIIGIVLLCILCLVLLILCAVLFVPIRYRAVGNKETDEELYIRAVLSYLLHLISAQLIYNDGKLIMYIKILGIVLKKKIMIGGEEEEIEDPDIGSPKQKKEKHQDKEKSKEKQKDVKTENPKEKEPDISDLSSPDKGYYKIESAEAENITTRTFEEYGDEKGDNGESEKSSSAGNVYKKIKDFFDFVFGIIKKLSDIICGLFTKTEETVNRLQREYDFYTRFLEDERNQKAYRKLKAETIKVLKHIKPRRIKGRVHFGLEDPADTGQALAYLAMVYPVLPRKLYIVPDFEDNVFEGNLLIKGYFTIFRLLVSFVRIYFDKDFKRLTRIYKRHRNKVNA